MNTKNVDSVTRLKIAKIASIIIGTRTDAIFAYSTIKTRITCHCCRVIVTGYNEKKILVNHRDCR